MGATFSRDVSYHGKNAVPAAVISRAWPAPTGMATFSDMRGVSFRGHGPLLRDIYTVADHGHGRSCGNDDILRYARRFISRAWPLLLDIYTVADRGRGRSCGIFTPLRIAGVAAPAGYLDNRGRGRSCWIFTPLRIAGVAAPAGHIGICVDYSLVNRSIFVGAGHARELRQRLCYR